METKSSKSNLIYLIPLAFIIGVVPLIVFAKKISIEGVLVDYWSKQIDFFSYYKMVWFLVATLVAVGLFLIYFYRKKRLKETYYYLLIQVYAIFIILSTYYAGVKEVALWGFPDRYEGMFVLLAYLIVLFITINVVDFKKDIRFLIRVLFVSSTIISIIGIMQYVGFDIFTTLFGKKFILPTEMYNIIDKINIKFDYIFATLYNPNYVGSYTAMLLPFAITLYIFTSSIRKQLILAIPTLLIFSNWLGSLSRAGMLGGIIGVGSLFLFLRREVFKRLKAILILGIGFMLVFTMMNYVSDGRLVNEVFSFGSEAQIAMQGESGALEDIVINKDQLQIVTEEDRLEVKLIQDNKLSFVNKRGKKINYNLEADTGIIKLKANRYKDYKFQLGANKQILHLEYGKKKVEFRMTKKPEQGFWIIGFADKAYKTGKIEKWGFEGRERLGSGRGYIWSRSIPMLRDTIITGYGPDTYGLYFPQFDNVGKIITFNTTRIIVDKPHNMYLQIAINTGVISLLAVLLLFGSYIYSSIKLYWNREMNDFHSKVGLGILVGVVGYLVAGLFNDSVISVAPVFWTLLGMGISINLKLKKERIQE
ncbi:MAG: O-antigen polymerase [Candidatus Frackibacter sp. T328-2]|nr:MAG: O-antigen polymerase [Candidatus Frackibacter sp. T328-2]